MAKKKFKQSYLVIPLIVLCISFASQFATQDGMTWYDSLIRPPLTPPDYAFGIAWTIIYILTATSAILVWNREKDTSNRNMVMGVFGFNAALNLAWSYIFFMYHFIDIALYEAMLLELTLIYMVYESYRISKAAGLLLLPYLIWMGFALYLNYEIMALN